MNGSGDFVVVWQSQDPSGYGIFGQLFNRSAAMVGAPFRVNTYARGPQALPSVAMSESGNFLVVWQSWDGSEDGIFGQRFDSSGAKTGSEFMINTYTSGSQNRPVVAFSKSGDSIVAWESDSRDESGFDVFAQRFDRTGARVGWSSRSTSTRQTFTNSQSSLTMAADSRSSGSAPAVTAFTVAGRISIPRLYR